MGGLFHTVRPGNGKGSHRRGPRKFSEYAHPVVSGLLAPARYMLG